MALLHGSRLARGPDDLARVRGWWAARTPFAQDALVAATVALVGMVALVLEPESAVRGVERPADAVAVLLVLGLSLPMAWRRRAPLACLVVPAASAVLVIERGYAAFVICFFLLFGVASAAALTDRRTAVLLGLAGAAAMSTLTTAEDTGGLSFVTLAVGLLVGVAPAAIGDAFRMQAALTRSVQEQALRHEQLQAAELRHAVERERVGLAREVHDIIGHHLSAIALQLGAARRASTSDPGATQRLLGASEQLTRNALDETRRVLGALGETGARLDPTPRLADLPALLGDDDAGPAVVLGVEGGRRELPASIEACAVRVVTSTVAAVARDAAQRVAVTLAYGPGHLRVRVERGPGPSACEPPVLAGLRERVELLGGTVEARTTSAGGWVVAATLPDHVGRALPAMTSEEAG